MAVASARSSGAADDRAMYSLTWSCFTTYEPMTVPFGIEKAFALMASSTSKPGLAEVVEHVGEPLHPVAVELEEERAGPGLVHEGHLLEPDRVVQPDVAAVGAHEVLLGAAEVLPLLRVVPVELHDLARDGGLRVPTSRSGRDHRPACPCRSRRPRRRRASCSSGLVASVTNEYLLAPLQSGLPHHCWRNWVPAGTMAAASQGWATDWTSSFTSDGAAHHLDHVVGAGVVEVVLAPLLERRRARRTTRA